MSLKYALSETPKEIIQVSVYVQDVTLHLLLQRLQLEFGRYEMCEAAHKTSALKMCYFKHTAYASCLVALGLIFLSIGFPRVAHCISRLAKRSNSSLAVLMLPYEIQLSRQWHQDSVLRRRQERLMDEPQDGSFSLARGGGRYLICPDGKGQAYFCFHPNRCGFWICLGER